MNGILKVGYEWTVVEVDYELGRYLRSLFKLSNYNLIKLGQPSNKEHITVISPYDKISLLYRNLLKDYDNTLIHFNIEFELYTNGNAYWVPVISKQLEDLRSRCGLSRHPAIELHFCVGYERIGKDVIRLS